jgi:hypothetical protein
MPAEWSIVLALHYSRPVAASLHALQVLTALRVRTSCRPMMAMMSIALKICAHALGTCMSSCTGRTDGLFLCLRHAAHKEPRDTWQRWNPPQTEGEVQSHSTRDSVGAPPPPSAGGEVQSYMTHGSAEAHLSLDARSEAVGTW